jgi:L-iditol 2-dehydrogenase
MLQAIMTKPGIIEFRQVEKPKITENEILMQTKRIGICGSDIHVFDGLHPYTRYPIVQGHEVSGIVADVGTKVCSVKIGDNITLTPQVTCGQCYACKNGMHHICDVLKVMGFQTDGAAQEYFVISEDNVFKLPKTVHLDHGAFVEPVAVGVHAVRRVGDVSGKKILVLGAGTIGNLIGQVSKALGAKSVLITDILNYKLEKARECEIDYCVNSAQEDLGYKIISCLGKDKADVIFECVGVQATAEQAIQNARKGTPIIIVGVFPKKTTIDLGLVQDRELSLTGTLMYQRTDYEIAIDLIEEEKIQLDPLLTHSFEFANFLDAYQTIKKSNGEYMKAMIKLE